MFLCGKKTIYLNLYEDDKKVCNAGFAQFCGSNNRLMLSVHIKRGGDIFEGKYPIFIQGNKEAVCLGEILLRHGVGTFEKKWNIQNETVIIENKSIAWKDMLSLRISGLNEQLIWGHINGGMSCKVHTISEVSEKEVDKDCELRQIAEKNSEQEINVAEFVIQENFCHDKWEQLLKEYPNIHPFGDDRVFISIEPKDFLVLEESCQRLVHNSFLLHGFYNYRHVILGKDKRMGSVSETCFYLGVPGTFFEREKQVAVMFGFEGFESAGAVEIGKFGYYMREVFI